MFIAKKNIVVAVFSSVVIAVVFISTLVGYSLYIQWKKDSFALRYQNSIYELTAELFKKDVILSNVVAKVGDDGFFSDAPFLEGSLKNSTKKTITSVLIEVSFVKPDGEVVYHDWFHPLGEERINGSIFTSDKKRTRSVILPDEDLTFRHALRNCPKEVIEKLSTKAKLAKAGSKDELSMVYSIKGLSVL